MKNLKSPEKMVLTYSLIAFIILIIFGLSGTIEWTNFIDYTLILIITALIIGISLIFLGKIFKLETKRVSKTLSIIVGIIIVFVAEYFYNIIIAQTNNIAKSIIFISAFITLFIAVYYAIGKFDL